MRIEGARDRWAAALFGGASLMIMALPLLMLVEVVGAGLPRLSWEFMRHRWMPDAPAASVR